MHGWNQQLTQRTLIVPAETCGFSSSTKFAKNYLGGETK
jgi:hypothetical protein